MRIALEQRPRGWARFAPMQFRAAGARQVKGALDGLESACSGRRMRWWGWGEDGHDAPLPERGAGAAARRARRSCPAARPRAGRARRRAPAGASRCRAPARERLAAIVGAEHVRDDRLARVTHAAGRGYHDLVRLRAGDASRRARRGRLPGRAEEVAAVLRRLRRGAGRGRPVRRRHERRRRRRAARAAASPRWSRSTSRGSTALLAVDPVSLHRDGARPACSGPALEAALAEHGLTLGHFPQSFEFSTVGGWVATRSAGQASTGYGRIDALVVALRVVTPSGRDRDARGAGDAPPGPSLRELLVGSEGDARRDQRGHAARAPAPERAPLRGLLVPSLRGGRRRLPRARAGGRVARRGAPLRRAGDALSLALVERRAGSRRARGAATCAPAATTAAAS